jgi:hypothetical protein
MDLVLSAIIKESISSAETIRFVLSTKSLSLISEFPNKMQHLHSNNS